MHLHILAFLCVLGTFTRVTFVAFALPIIWQYLRWTGPPTSPNWSIQSQTFLLSCVTAALTALAIVLTDTYYFRGDTSTLIITPLNFLEYNLSPRNLAEHGIHPRCLHLFVNLPMIVGPSLLWLAGPAGIRHWQVPIVKREDVNHVIDRSELLSCCRVICPVIDLFLHSYNILIPRRSDGIVHSTASRTSFPCAFLCSFCCVRRK